MISISSSAKTSWTRTVLSSFRVSVDHSKAKKRIETPSTIPIRMYVPRCLSRFAFGDFFTSSLFIVNLFYLLLVLSLCLNTKIAIFLFRSAIYKENSEKKNFLISFMRLSPFSALPAPSLSPFSRLQAPSPSLKIRQKKPA